MKCRNVFSCALGLGLAGGLVGYYAYMNMPPSNQKKLRKSINRATDDMANVAEDIGQTIRNMR
ncbi:hypothetical protein [Anaerovorax odorimutans]|uniref:hypothetical protein n=1 Tax=Anaerovorax odorimutans TaxID=109327 RepID=UPI0004205824|nr:hypothetical protein [Anaerovorax odorimutans]